MTRGAGRRPQAVSVTPGGCPGRRIGPAPDGEEASQVPPVSAWGIGMSAVPPTGGGGE